VTKLWYVEYTKTVEQANVNVSFQHVGQLILDEFEMILLWNWKTSTLSIGLN
jgi:hypothetical protein